MALSSGAVGKGTSGELQEEKQKPRRHYQTRDREERERGLVRAQVRVNFVHPVREEKCAGEVSPACVL